MRLRPKYKIGRIKSLAECKKGIHSKAIRVKFKIYIPHMPTIQNLKTVPFKHIKIKMYIIKTINNQRDIVRIQSKSLILIINCSVFYIK